MTAITPSPSDVPTAAAGARPRPAWKGVAVPIEHGGWSLTLEPALLGLLIVPSVAGVAVGLAALVTFVVRTPVRVVLVDTRRGRRLPRTALAARIAAAELVVLAALGALAVSSATGAFWVPLLLAAPLVVVELGFARRSRSRRLVPELAGAVAAGSVAAAVLLAGGGPATVAAAAWLAVGARVVASIPFARYQLARTKARSEPRWSSDVAQLATVALAVAGAVAGWLPLPAVAALGLLAAVQLGLSRARPTTAMVVGLGQLVAGLAVMITTALALRGALP